MRKEVEDGIKRTPAEKNPWYQFLQFTIELDEEFDESFGTHWFAGIYLLQDELHGFKKLELQQIKDALPDGHEFRKIDILQIPIPMDLRTKLDNVRDNLLEKDAFKKLDGMLERYDISQETSKEKITKIDFSKLNFEDSIDFSKLVFPMDVSFQRTRFATPPHFINTVFCGAADFDRAVFSNGADFCQARFSGETYLSRINFYQNMYHTTFSKAVFSGLTIIRDTKFHGHTYFEKTVFNDWAVFENAEFNYPVEFKEATFFDRANFTNTTFATWVTFKGTTFSDEVTFEGATIHKSIKFDNVKITGRIDFTKAEFKEHVPSFHSAHLHPDVFWDMVEWPHITNRIKDEPDDEYKKRIKANQNAYETLAYHMEGLDKHHDQHFFFRKETRCRQIFEKNLFVKVFYWLYETIANFGYGVERALFYWSLHILLGGLLIWFITKDVACSFLTSFANAHGFLFFNNGPLEKCYGTFTEIPIFKIIWGTQTIIGIAFLFLLLLTLRIRFRLK